MSKEAMKLEMVDDEGENQAVRMFLALYGGQYGINTKQMRKHLEMAGFDGAWPEWANSHNGHLTKSGAQLWIRHLFALAEQPAMLLTDELESLFTNIDHAISSGAWNVQKGSQTWGIIEEAKAAYGITKGQP